MEESKFNFDCKKKIEYCLKCKHMNSLLSLNDGSNDFTFSIKCDLKCPDLLCFDCMQCLLCDHFEKCLRDDCEFGV